MTTERGPVAGPGHLYGIGVGPGDPELMTIKARRLIEHCPVVAHFAARTRPGNAWSIVAPLIGADQTVVRLDYPLTTEAVAKPDYEQQLSDFYDNGAERLAQELDGGRDVAVVCEGDPFFYGSYMYIHQRLAHRYDVTVVPGVPSFCAACAAAGIPLVSMNEVLTILPGVLPVDALQAALAGTDAAVIMKVGRHLEQVRSAAQGTGLDGRAVYVERASCADERIVGLADTGDVHAPYFSLVLVPGRGLASRGGGAEPA